MNGYKIVVTKSTVPVEQQKRCGRSLPGKPGTPSRSLPTRVLKGRRGIDDFMKPDRIILGVEDAHVEEVLNELYAPLSGRVIPFSP